MEIEVGEFVRTDYGIIDKVINPNFYISMYIECEQNLIQRGKIVKHSKNIIDLIEVNDLVKTNEEKTIIHIYDNDILEAVKEDIEEGHFKIETIVTHEMFESIEYKVWEDK